MASGSTPSLADDRGAPNCDWTAPASSAGVEGRSAGLCFPASTRAVRGTTGGSSDNSGAPPPTG
eukprot:5998998-Alexandrium_andersonii.AAC.1